MNYECNLNIDAIQDEGELITLSFVFKVMSNYAHFKSCAVRERLAGRITAAKVYEKECETLYKQLPAKWKW